MKQYLLDTHTLLWIVSNPEKLSEKAKNIFFNEDITLYYSYMSLWEISIKTSIGKLKLETTIQQFIEKLNEKGLIMIYPTIADINSISQLPFYKHLNIEHRDPFDRMLIVQTINLKIEIISTDEKFDLYPNIVRIW